MGTDDAVISTVFNTRRVPASVLVTRLARESMSTTARSETRTPPHVPLLRRTIKPDQARSRNRDGGPRCRCPDPVLTSESHLAAGAKRALRVQTREGGRSSGWSLKGHVDRACCSRAIVSPSVQVWLLAPPVPPTRSGSRVAH